MPDQAVRYGKDNYSTCRVMEFGSPKKDCRMVARKIGDLVETFEIMLAMVWRGRNTEEIGPCAEVL